MPKIRKNIMKLILSTLAGLALSSSLLHAQGWELEGARLGGGRGESPLKKSFSPMVASTPTPAFHPPQGEASAYQENQVATCPKT